MQFFNTHTHFSIHPSFEILQNEVGKTCPHFHSSGVHPWNAESYIGIRREEFIENIDSEYLMAIGEIGLDKIKGPDLAVQINVLKSQIEISEALQLPAIIHCVKAWNELKGIKKELKPSQTWIYHGFTQSAIVHEVVREGLMISIGSAIIDHPKRQEIIDSIPNEQLLLETDDSDLEIIEIYKCVAELKKISLRELTKIVAHNFKNTFHKWQNGLSAPN